MDGVVAAGRGEGVEGRGGAELRREAKLLGGSNLSRGREAGERREPRGETWAADLPARWIREAPKP